MAKSLTHSCEIGVRFSECDPLNVVWHGNYAKYFEDGRDEFLKKYELSFSDVYMQTKIAVPLVHLECNYKKMVGFGEKLIVEAKMVDTPAAKIIFEYRIFNALSEVVCTGKTIQVFLNLENKELILSMPPFFEEWKRKYLL